MNFHDLTKRLFVASITILIIAVIIFFSSNAYVQGLIFAIIGALIGVATYEYTTLLKLRFRPYLIVMSVLVAFAFYLSRQEEMFSLGAMILILMYFRSKENAFQNIGTSLFGILYIAIPLSMMLDILDFGRMWLVYLLVVTKVTDMAAYFAGRAFGKHKLAPQLSPGKTIEGAVVGLVCAVGISLCFSLFTFITLEQSLYLGLALGVLGQVGDLAESLLKRQVGVKDSNRLPGLGGILDMVDSLLFTTPVLYFTLL